ncbi:MAG: LCP family protein [Clostridiaceae bacterium]|nr:LCP family protein [Clostridiaceae bacterium]
MEAISNLRKKRLIKYMIGLLCLIIIGILIGLVTVFVLSIRPPERGSSDNFYQHDNENITEVVSNNKEPNSTYAVTKKENEVYTFLVAGKDAIADNTDIIMLVIFDVTDKKIKILHIPRDTMIDTERKIKKINACYHAEGIEEFKRNVTNMTGFSIDKYFIFNIEGVEKIIDAIGGVEFYVPRNLYYKDPTQNLYINFKKGQQHLTGAQTVKLARYRNSYKNGDIGRIEMQQKLLKALAEQALKYENIIKIPEIASIILDNVETDISLGSIIWLANQVKDIKISDIDMFIVPGREANIDSVSYWLPDKDEFLNLINNEINPFSSPVAEEDISTVLYP